jgi:ADP-heptose:LPS heptosyltransferase
MAFNRAKPLRSRLVVGALTIAARLKSRLTGGAGSRNGFSSVTRILVLELWNIGDVILTMPFLAQLRWLFPHARITLLARPLARDIMAGTGLVDEIIPADLTWTPTSGRAVPRVVAGVWRAVRALRARRFDLAFSARAHLREHILLALCGARRTFGYPISDGRSVLSDSVHAAGPHDHKVQSWMRLLDPFGGPGVVGVPRLHISVDEQTWADRYLASHGFRGEDLLIGMHPGASLVEKRWPVDRFAEVANTIGALPGVKLLVFAEPSGYGSELFTVPGVIPARVTLREMIALIARCGLLVCNDSGPMHIAGALGVSTVALFGPGIERWFAPLGENHELLRAEAGAIPERAASEGAIRSPAGIHSTQVLDAVHRALLRLRGGRTLTQA